MKKLILFSFLMSIHAHASELSMEELTDYQSIDGALPTLLMFPEPANLALSSPFWDLKPVLEGDASSVWKITPNSALREDVFEFVLSSGKHLILKLKLSDGIKDHVLSIKEPESMASVGSIRNKIVPLARQTFLRVVRYAPSLPKAEEEVPESIKKLAKLWKSYKTEQLLLHVGSSYHAQKEDIEQLKEKSLVMVGFFDRSIVVIFRRNP